MTTTATAVWRLRTGGNDNNGGGYDPGLAGAGTDYSQQDSAQQLFTTRLTTSGAGSTTLTDGSAGSLFTSAMVGNAINITAGTNFQAGIYWITSFTNANNVVLDRTPSSGAAGSAGTGRVGGAWRNFFPNTNSAGPVVGGNIIYVRASGSGSIGSPDYSAASGSESLPAGSASGLITIVGENGRPYISTPAGYWTFNNNYWFENLYLFCNGTGNLSYGLIQQMENVVIYNVIFDQNGNDQILFGDNQDLTFVIGCEFGNTGGGAAGSSSAFAGGGTSTDIFFIGCNFHDLRGHAINMQGGGTIIDCIIAKNKGYGIILQYGWHGTVILGNTIDANTSDGILLQNLVAPISNAVILGNIISNHTTGGTYGLNVSTSDSQATNDRLRGLIDFNNFYNNTTNVNGITLGGSSTLRGHPYSDTTLDPQYTDAAHENYSIGTNLKAKGYPASFLNSLATMVAPRSYTDTGAVQRQEPASSGAIIVNQIKNLFINRKVI